MDTDEFLRRSDHIEKGLHKLADELYRVLRKGVSGPERDDVISRANEKVQLYDEFFALLDDEEDREEAEGFLGDNIQRLRRNLLKLESGGE